MIRVTAVGHLATDPSLRYTNNGQPLCTFRLACNRGVARQDGQETSDFMTVVTWGKAAEFTANYVEKGGLVEISGNLRSRKMQNQRTGLLEERWELHTTDIQHLRRPLNREVNDLVQRFEERCTERPELAVHLEGIRAMLAEMQTGQAHNAQDPGTPEQRMIPTTTPETGTVAAMAEDPLLAGVS